MNGTPPPSQQNPHARAATAVWIAAGGLLLLGGCLSAGLAAIAAVPADTLAANPAVAAMPEADRRQLMQLRAGAGPAAAVTLLLMALPAAGLVGLGFAVRRARPRATRFTRVLCIALAFLLGLWTVTTLAGGAAALPMALVQGMLAALLWRAGQRLHPDRLGGLRPAGTHVSAHNMGDTDNDPWDAVL